jgi:hypothetical protein
MRPALLQGHTPHDLTRHPPFTLHYPACYLLVPSRLDPCPHVVNARADRQLLQSRSRMQRQAHIELCARNAARATSLPTPYARRKLGSAQAQVALDEATQLMRPRFWDVEEQQLLIDQSRRGLATHRSEAPDRLSLATSSIVLPEMASLMNPPFASIASSVPRAIFAGHNYTNFDPDAGVHSLSVTGPAATALPPMSASPAAGGHSAPPTARGPGEPLTLNLARGCAQMAPTPPSAPPTARGPGDVRPLTATASAVPMPPSTPRPAMLQMAPNTARTIATSTVSTSAAAVSVVADAPAASPAAAPASAPAANDDEFLLKPLLLPELVWHISLVYDSKVVNDDSKDRRLEGISSVAKRWTILKALHSRMYRLYGTAHAMRADQVYRSCLPENHGGTSARVALFFELCWGRLSNTRPASHEQACTKLLSWLLIANPHPPPGDVQLKISLRDVEMITEKLRMLGFIPAHAQPLLMEWAEQLPLVAGDIPMPGHPKTPTQPRSAASRMVEADVLMLKWQMCWGEWERDLSPEQTAALLGISKEEQQRRAAQALASPRRKMWKPKGQIRQSAKSAWPGAPTNK